MPHAYQIHLSDVVRDFKKFTSGKLINEIRFGNDEKKDSMLNTFSTGGKKQKKKSNNQIPPSAEFFIFYDENKY